MVGVVELAVAAHDAVEHGVTAYDAVEHGVTAHDAVEHGVTAHLSLRDFSLYFLSKYCGFTKIIQFK